MKRSPLIVPLLMTLGLLLAACGVDGASSPSTPERDAGETSGRTTQSPPQETPEKTGEAAGDGPEGGEAAEASGETVTTLSGEKVTLGGGEVTALYFMAGW